jgi:hypothetical protein
MVQLIWHGCPYGDNASGDYGSGGNHALIDAANLPISSVIISERDMSHGAEDANTLGDWWVGAGDITGR